MNSVLRFRNVRFVQRASKRIPYRECRQIVQTNLSRRDLRWGSCQQKILRPDVKTARITVQNSNQTVGNFACFFGIVLQQNVINENRIRQLFNISDSGSTEKLPSFVNRQHITHGSIEGKTIQYSRYGNQFSIFVIICIQRFIWIAGQELPYILCGDKFFVYKSSIAARASRDVFSEGSMGKTTYSMSRVAICSYWCLFSW